MAKLDDSYSLDNLFSMKGKTALVIGGAGYLGSQISEAFAELDANLIVASRNLANCTLLANQIKKKYSINVDSCQVDITCSKSVDRLFESVSLNYDSLDILVNCGWSGKKNSWESITIEDWSFDLEVSLTGPFRVIKTFCPLMMKSKSPAILNISTMYANVAPDYRIYEGTDHANPPSYGAAKAGIIQFTRYLASFLSPYNIRANCISPGPFPFPSTSEKYPEFAERLKSKVPLNRLGRPHEVKGIAALLCSDAGSYINGQNVCIDGGWTSW